jgi:hypothetical protein
MTPVNRDFDDMLRRALHAAADRIEPADDGLERIRRRLNEPWLGRQVSLMLTECADLGQLIVIRLEPAFTRLWSALAALGKSAGASFSRLGSRVPALAALGALLAPSRRHGAAHRGQSQRGWARLRPTLAWLRPALAVASAVLIVVAGFYGLAQLRETLVLTLFPGSTTASTGPGPASSGPSGPGHSVTPSAGGVAPASTRPGSGSPSPKASCSGTSKTTHSPTPSPSSSPSDSTSPSASPSPQPTGNLNPTPTPSSASSPLPASSSAVLGSADRFAGRAAGGHCTQPGPLASASPSRRPAAS